LLFQTHAYRTFVRSGVSTTPAQPHRNLGAEVGRFVDDVAALVIEPGSISETL